MNKLLPFKDFLIEKKESRLKKAAKSTVATTMLFNAVLGTGVNDKINKIFKMNFGTPHEKFYHMTKDLPKKKNPTTGRMEINTDNLSEEAFKKLQVVIQQMNSNSRD
jgi:hypothetical protein